MKYKIKDLMLLQEALQQHLEIKSREFSRVLTVNINVIDSTLERVKKDYMIKWHMTKEMNAFIEEQKKVLVKYATMGEDGDIYIDPETQRPEIKKTLAYERAMSIVRKKHEIGESQLIQRNKAWFETMEELVDIDFALIKREKDLPESISTKERLGLAFMLSKKLSGCL